jgi:hypothetical protein
MVFLECVTSIYSRAHLANWVSLYDRFGMSYRLLPMFLPGTPAKAVFVDHRPAD